MQQKIEVCQQCFIPNLVNSKHICPSCVFKNNHNGKSQFEVYNERAKLNKSIKVDKLPISELKPVKRVKNKIKVNSDKIERRRQILKKDEDLYEYIFNTKPPFCEECSEHLPDQFRDDDGNIIYRAQYSHIFSHVLI